VVRRILSLCLVVGLGLPPQLARGQSGTVDADMATGVRQVREGDFDAALITLDGVVKRLSGQPGQAKELARAYTYLAIAYVGLAQQETARAKFLAAWKVDRSMTLSPKEFPPNIIQFFEEAKKEGEEKAKAETKPVAATPTPAPVTAAATPEKKGGGHTGLILLGAGVGAAAIVAVAAAGKSSSTPPTTLTPPPATLADLSATVDSPQASSNISCTDNVFLTVTLRNAARSSVSVSAVRVEHTVLSGELLPQQPLRADSSHLLRRTGGHGDAAAWSPLRLRRGRLLSRDLLGRLLPVSGKRRRGNGSGRGKGGGIRLWRDLQGLLGLHLLAIASHVLPVRSTLERC
jgi:hypothetical protein